MAGLDPAIHDAAQRRQSYVRLRTRRCLMDARVKPAHDSEESGANQLETALALLRAGERRVPSLENPVALRNKKERP
jgi:hypothetical protein